MYYFVMCKASSDGQDLHCRSHRPRAHSSNSILRFAPFNGAARACEVMGHRAISLWRGKWIVRTWQRRRVVGGSILGKR